MSKTAQSTLWILEDEEELRNLYERKLSKEFEVLTFPTIASFVKQLGTLDNKKYPTCVLADIHLTDGNLFDVTGLSEWKNLVKHSHVFVVSTSDDFSTLRKCFQLGIRDYLTKPVKLSELQVKLERSTDVDIKLDTQTLKVCFNGLESPALTIREMQVVSILLSAPDNTTSREKIVEELWKEEEINPKTFDVHLVNLRHKLKTIGLNIKNAKNGNYCLGLKE